MGFICVSANPNRQVPFAVPVAVPSHRYPVLGGDCPHGQGTGTCWWLTGQVTALPGVCSQPDYLSASSTGFPTGVEQHMAAVIFKHKINILCNN